MCVCVCVFFLNKIELYLINLCSNNSSDNKELTSSICLLYRSFLVEYQGFVQVLNKYSFSINFSGQRCHVRNLNVI